MLDSQVQDDGLRWLLQGLKHVETLRRDHLRKIRTLTIDDGQFSEGLVQQLTAGATTLEQAGKKLRTDIASVTMKKKDLRFQALRKLVDFTDEWEPQEISDTKGGSRRFCQGAVIHQQNSTLTAKDMEDPTMHGAKGGTLCKYCYLEIAVPQGSGRGGGGEADLRQQLEMFLLKCHIMACKKDNQAYYRCYICSDLQCLDFRHASGLLYHYSLDHWEAFLESLEAALPPVLDLWSQMADLGAASTNIKGIMRLSLSQIVIPELSTGAEGGQRVPRPSDQMTLMAELSQVGDDLVESTAQSPPISESTVSEIETQAPKSRTPLAPRRRK